MIDSTVTIIIPAHNEEKTLPDILETLASMPEVGDILVVNDGSTDRTADVVASSRARLISHSTRRGNGAAVKTGLKIAQSKWVVIMDADGQHSASDVALLMNCAPEFDLVVGARPFHWTQFRDFGNLVLRGLAQFLTNHPIPDLTSGLRRINRKAALQFWHMYPQTFSFPSTNTLLMLSAGYNVRFIPIKNCSRPDHASTSKLNPLQEGLRFLAIIYRIVLLTNPLRFMAPVGLTFMALGGIWIFRTIYINRQVSAGGALLFLAGLTILLFGTIADQLSQIRKAMTRIDDSS